MEQLLAIDKLSRLLKVKKNTIYHWTCAGFIPYMKVGRSIRFQTAEIERWLQKRKRNGRKTMVVR